MVGQSSDSTPALPVIPPIIEDVPGMIVIIIEWCVLAIQTLLHIMDKLVICLSFNPAIRSSNEVNLGRHIPLCYSNNILCFDFTLGEFEEGWGIHWSVCPFPTVFGDCSFILAWALSSPQLWYHVNLGMFYVKSNLFQFSVIFISFPD